MAVETNGVLQHKKSEYYESFSNLVTARLVISLWLDHVKVQIGKHIFELYEMGPKEIACPIICLPPSTCDAKIYYKIQLFLSREGYRVISVSVTLIDFGLDKLPKHL